MRFVAKWIESIYEICTIDTLKQISYTDFLLYQLLNHYNGAQIDVNRYPRFDTFVKTIQSRPSLKKHFETERKESSEL